jgi:hypothetical protein
MSFLRLFNEPDFDYELRRSLRGLCDEISAPAGARRRVLETAALTMECARPGSQQTSRKGARLPTYKDIEHRMSNNIMLYATPLGFGMLSLRA